jgi:hypothetical protein
MIRLSDVFIPSVYGSYTAVNNPETSALVRAGVVSNSPLLNQVARGGGKLITVPFWKDIDPSIEPNYSNDDPADLAVPNKIGSGTFTARTVWMNQGFGEMDLVQELAGESPLRHVRNRFGEYWTRQQNRRVIATSVGLLADNVANDGGDMLIDISAVGDGKITGDSFVDAAYTLGDNAESITAVAVHSSIMAKWVKNDDVVDVRDSQGNLVLQTYKGRAIIVDDLMPVSGAGADRVYTSILFGRGAIGFGGVEGNVFAVGVGTPKTPFAISRTEEAGNGGGMESIWERRTWMLHPFGYEWIEGSLAEMSPTLADLRLAAHWNRVVDRKQVPIAFLKSKA